MARYIDADWIYEKVENRYRVSSGIEHRCERDLLNLICEAPTADVVPKSEVVLASSDAVKMLIECHGYALTHDSDVKREVAREIFEEIEKLHLHVTNDFDARRYAELKKKYTEQSCNNCATQSECDKATHFENYNIKGCMDFKEKKE